MRLQGDRWYGVRVQSDGGRAARDGGRRPGDRALFHREPAHAARAWGFPRGQGQEEAEGGRGQSQEGQGSGRGQNQGHASRIRQEDEDGERGAKEAPRSGQESRLARQNLSPVDDARAGERRGQYAELDGDGRAKAGRALAHARGACPRRRSRTGSRGAAPAELRHAADDARHDEPVRHDARHDEPLRHAADDAAGSGVCGPLRVRAAAGLRRPVRVRAAPARIRSPAAGLRPAPARLWPAGLRRRVRRELRGPSGLRPGQRAGRRGRQEQRRAHGLLSARPGRRRRA